MVRAMCWGGPCPLQWQLRAAASHLVVGRGMGLFLMPSRCFLEVFFVSVELLLRCAQLPSGLRALPSTCMELPSGYGA
eukprot:7990700-Alexandrium_andersonii.AAC.1